MSNVHSIRQNDGDRSTVGEEVEAMDWEISNIFRLLSELEKQPNESSRGFMVAEAKRRLNKVTARAYRAEQLSRGLRVTKVT
jgi:hypothetical protein